MSTTTNSDKAVRLLTTGAVRIVVVTDRGVVVADVTGDTGQRTVTRNRTRGWTCTCPAWTFRQCCAHVDAVALVVHPLPNAVPGRRAAA